MNSTSSPDHSPKRLCVVRPSALGDVCRTVPVLVSLRQAYPDARIDWIVQDQFIDAVIAHPAVNEIIPFHRKHFGRFGRSFRSTTDYLKWSSELRSRKYDVVYDCQGLARSALITWSTRATKRVGYARAREFASVAYTHRHPVDTDLHTVEQMLSLIEHDGITPVRDMRLYTPTESADWWTDQRERLEIGNQPYAVIAPTSRWPAKRWPIERFAQIIPPLLERDLSAVVVVGAAGERGQCKPIFTMSRENGPTGSVIDCLGKTTVGQLMAVIESANIIIANDSASLHMAVGFDRPTVALYGPTDISRVGPYEPLTDTSTTEEVMHNRNQRTTSRSVSLRSHRLKTGATDCETTSKRIVLQHVEPGEKLNHKDLSKTADALMQRIEVQEVIGKVDQLLSLSP